MEKNHKSSNKSNSACEKICKAFSHACCTKRTRPVSYRYQTPAFPKPHHHVQDTKQEPELGHNKIAAKGEPHHNRDHFRRSATDLNNRISEYLNRVGNTIRTSSFVGHDHAGQVEEKENKSHLDESVANYIQRAKKKISATSSSVGMGKGVSLKSNEKLVE